MQTNSGPATFPVSGNVTWNGKPLDTGTVFFVPSSNLENGTSVEIASGTFDSVALGQQLVPGEYRVEITSSQATGKMIPGPGPNGKVKEVVQIIPAKYNSQSELSAVVMDAPTNQYQFELTGKSN